MVIDFLIRIKNAALARKKEVKLPAGKKVRAVAEALRRLGYFQEIKENKVILSYKNKRPVLLDLKVVSKPGLRVYLGVAEVEKAKGPFLYLLSTPRGILSSKEAIKQRVGGEVIAKLI